ncbi:uncharacterized protein LOC111264933 isoform X1 [Varroa jacobsoni]|uniref:uncharacterized protein LOC111264933 isoform X1 n=1 Tax=Varroa jacobsoni TaxID=62625 RepID=UPI000BF896E3|nr:uncharacterized protein LOC111264933 isoform X1 [Varroa jacobsoni]XP_022696951.1 uncharacterized protein LOC111264933 isoform X1 [Varroa jacobsoni]XP_022696958.1 uncharacterized protein LOC111264933 isoform X1 [Varroa jacobsoni]XP_022696963.1 uncharacterized protein LOC111264933 isoform X1 [Varroa jacobsoni]XP_022696972.1 uncharacterized protein LOC111264933 isoform X1 [Varroa jacobsoni]
MMLHLPKSARYPAGSRGSGSRLPPVALAGMAIAACLAIVVYWHQVSEYRALEERYRELQEKFRLFVEKKEALQRQYNDLQNVSQDASRKIKDTKERLTTCEKERETLDTTLREKQWQLDAAAAKATVAVASLPFAQPNSASLKQQQQQQHPNQLQHMDDTRVKRL